MNADTRVLVIRPEEQATALLNALRERELEVEHLPMLRIDPIDPLPGPERQRILDLDRYQHVIFVSANAARIGIERITECWPQWPAKQRYWAVGASTAKLLRAEGLPAEFPESDMSSEGLLAMPGLASLKGQRVLIVKGEGGRQFLEENLRDRGALVDSLRCYQRSEVAHDPQRSRALLTGPKAQLILASSGEGLELLSRLLQPQEHTNLAAHTVVVPSPRVAERALALGWPQVQCAENASDAAMLAAVDLWRQTRMGEIQR